MIVITQITNEANADVLTINATTYVGVSAMIKTFHWYSTCVLLLLTSMIERDSG
jgi:hypothetical protein